MIIVILAAGRGSRLKKTLPKSFPYVTKSLINIDNEPAIKRLINQFLAINQNQIILVLGHKYESILKVVNKNQEFILNNDYKNDSNLRSLFIVAERVLNNKIYDIKDGLLVIEADSFFSNKNLENFIKHIYALNASNNSQNKICWTTKGYANFNDSGGFIDPLENKKGIFGKVKNVYIKSSPNNNKTMKMYGITWFENTSIIKWYQKANLLLMSKSPNDITGYFHEILFDDLKSYSMSYYDLGSKALSFNDYEEYTRCINSNSIK